MHIVYQTEREREGQRQRQRTSHIAHRTTQTTNPPWRDLFIIVVCFVLVHSLGGVNSGRRGRGACLLGCRRFFALLFHIVRGAKSNVVVYSHFFSLN